MNTDGMTLKLERIKARLRQQDVAHGMGVSRGAVSQYETQAVVRADVAERYRQAIASLTDVAESQSA